MAAACGAANEHGAPDVLLEVACNVCAVGAVARARFVVVVARAPEAELDVSQLRPRRLALADLGTGSPKELLMTVSSCVRAGVGGE